MILNKPHKSLPSSVNEMLPNDNDSAGLHWIVELPTTTVPPVCVPTIRQHRVFPPKSCHGRWMPRGDVCSVKGRPSSKSATTMNLSFSLLILLKQFSGLQIDWVQTHCRCHMGKGTATKCARVVLHGRLVRRLHTRLSAR